MKSDAYVSTAREVSQPIFIDDFICKAPLAASIHLNISTTIYRQKEQSQLNDPALFVSVVGILLVTDTVHTHILPPTGASPLYPHRKKMIK